MQQFETKPKRLLFSQRWHVQHVDHMTNLRLWAKRCLSVCGRHDWTHWDTVKVFPRRKTRQSWPHEHPGGQHIPACTPLTTPFSSLHTEITKRKASGCWPPLQTGSQRSNYSSSRSGVKVRIWYYVKAVLWHIDYWTNRADVEGKRHVVIKVHLGQIIHHH